MIQQIKRQVLTDSDFEEITFEKISGHYFVKNFSATDIYVSFNGDTATEENSIKIPANFYEDCIAIGYNDDFDYETTNALHPYKTNSIFIKGLGEVEVQQL